MQKTLQRSFEWTVGGPMECPPTPLFNHLLPAFAFGSLLEIDSFGRVARNAVEEGSKGLIDHQLLHNQLVERNRNDTLSESFDLPLKFRFRKGMSQSPLLGLAPINRFSGE